MFYYRRYYESNKKIFNETSKKLIAFYKEIENNFFETAQKNNPNVEPMTKQELEKHCNSMADYYESCAYYTIYNNGYDPRMGLTLAVYIDKFPNSKPEYIESLLKKYFGEFKLRTTKQECKESNYRVFNKKALDYIFENGNPYVNSLNIIFRDNIYADSSKYERYMTKAPRNVIY